MTIINLQRITKTYRYGNKDLLTAWHIYNSVLGISKPK